MWIGPLAYGKALVTRIRRGVIGEWGAMMRAEQSKDRKSENIYQDVIGSCC
jgi:hypothetical protein